MSDGAQEFRGAVTRALTAVGLLAGVASFFYGLKQDDRSAWVWITLGVAVVAAIGQYPVRGLYSLLRKGIEQPRTLTLLATTQVQHEDAQADVARLTAAVPRAWEAGIAEGQAMSIGIVQALGVELVGKHLDMADGDTIITATVDPSAEPVEPRGRFVLVTHASDRAIAILEVDDVGPPVVLRPTRWIDTDAWEHLTSKAIYGDPLPPGLALRQCVFEDYKSFPSIQTIEAITEENA